MRKLYCGGVFNFDYRQTGYQEQVAKDYRAIVLGTPDQLLQRSHAVPLNSGVEYIGPFYFESDGMVDRDIVESEIGMVRRCTDAVFLLDGAACPGTICELTMASLLGKNVYLFYLRKADDQETESALHTPCWYPIIHSSILNEHTHLYACSDTQEAVDKIQMLLESWQRN